MTATSTAIPKRIPIKKVEMYVNQFLTDNLPANIYFHDFAHAKNVKQAATKIGQSEKVSSEEQELLAIAALFHDTGMVHAYEGHEGESQIVAAAYLRENDYPEDKIEIVKQLIRVTDPKIAPASTLEKIICDADTAHIGQKKYRTNSEKLRKEWEIQRTDYYPTDLQWEQENLDFLQKEHTYYTKSARKLYKKRKLKNIKKTKKRLRKAQAAENKRLDEFSVAKNKAALTMFKTSLRNHIDLTAIADQKSNMMLSVNALLLTIGMPIFASYLSEKIFLLVPAVIFMATCVATMVFATLSTRPIKMNGKTNLSKLPTGKTNLFFFGNFYNIPLEPYQESVRKLIANKEQLDKSIINDLYFLGHSLGDKFRYLRICYNVFIVGIGVSLLAFLVSFWLSS